MTFANREVNRAKSEFLPFSSFLKVGLFVLYAEVSGIEWMKAP